MVENFQLDDTQKDHRLLFKIIDQLLKQHPQATVCAAVESTGGCENNWYQSLRMLQQTLNISVARLNPLGVVHNKKAGLKRNTTDKISAWSIAEYLIAHPEKVNYQRHDQWAGLRKQWGFIRNAPQTGQPDTQSIRIAAVYRPSGFAQVLKGRRADLGSETAANICHSDPAGPCQGIIGGQHSPSHHR
ncbi:hypothetical protein D3OALGA1CA_606 [Olavius algarvensis associated proteobacterium Delta 3]|nr:hypothetical protein D3OALGA1CA_606 [Olavius algarvensis associated proteobacterium Delta 3]CAB5103486.1 hypothetical protein D3OALGB2SA_1979 [Olavius algarvensis associated proteobacterium Delta 3]